MKALVFHGPRRLAWEEWPEPEPAPGEVVIAVRAVGICGSDLHGYTGESARRTAPLVMGHEFTGEVLSVPAGTPGIAVGDRVVARPFIHCGECEFCRSGRANLCRARRYIGTTMHGAMAERVAVPLDNLLPLAPQTSFALGSLTEPLAVAMHAARQAGELGGKRILVAGGGTIGLLAMIAVTATIGISAAGCVYGPLAAGLRVRETALPLLLLPVLAPVLLGATRGFEIALGRAPGGGWQWVGLLGIFAVVYLALGVVLWGPLLEET